MPSTLSTTLTAAAVAVGTALLTATPADAQDWRRAPAFGAVSLSAGFVPDPYVHRVTAGGTLDASRVIGGNCLGTIANAPDFRMYYSAGGYALTIHATSGADTTLVVNAPDGSWHCNDDWDGLDPGMTFPAPMSGQYDVWLGSYGGGRGIPAQIMITELY